MALMYLARMRPSESQRRVLRAVVELSGGEFPPTLEDIARHLGLYGRASVAYHVRPLRAAGLVVQRAGRPGVVLTAKGHKAAR